AAVARRIRPATGPRGVPRRGDDEGGGGGLRARPERKGAVGGAGVFGWLFPHTRGGGGGVVPDPARGLGGRPGSTDLTPRPVGRGGPPDLVQDTGGLTRGRALHVLRPSPDLVSDPLRVRGLRPPVPARAGLRRCPLRVVPLLLAACGRPRPSTHAFPRSVD